MNDDIYADDPVQVYINEVRKVTPLTTERKAECIRQIREHGPDREMAEKDLLEQTLLLVVTIAQKYSGSVSNRKRCARAGGRSLR